MTTFQIRTSDRQIRMCIPSSPTRQPGTADTDLGPALGRS